MERTLKICILLFVFLGMLLVGSEVMAATTTSITVDKPNIMVGDTVTATIKYTAAAWDLKVTADSGLTTSSTTQYANTTDSAENESKSFTVKYTASKTGDLYIYLTGDVTDESSTTADSVSKKVKVTVKEKVSTTDKKEDTTTDKDTSTVDKNTTTNKDTTTTEKPKEKSNNAYLKTLGVRITNSLAKELGIKTNEYDFTGFSKTKTSYNVTVPKNVNSLIVVATAADSNATVKISGNSGFEVGTNNKVTIKVTAEDGKTTKTYTIKVTKLAEEEEKPGNLIENEEGLFLTSLSIEGIELSPEFVKDTYSYTATLDDSTVNELEVKAEANNEKAKIDISGNTNLVEGENTINLLLTLDDSDIQTVYQIVVTKPEALVTDIPATNSTNQAQSSTTDIIGMFKGYVGIAILILVLMVVAVIVLIILLRKENKKIKEDEDIEEEIKAEEYNVYNNDENEFVNNQIPKDNFIESLYKQRNGNFDEEDLTEGEKETLEEISKQTEEIFAEKVEGQSVEYTSEETYDENPLEVRKRRRGKGKHSL